jgi:signal peptidase I
MKKRLFLIAVALMAAALIAGLVFALNAKASDVSKPITTPDENTVRYHVVGTSMDPTIKDGDWLLASTTVKTVKRDDVVIMRYPKDETKVYCRRVLGVSGDRIVMKYYSNVKITTVYSKEHPEGIIFPQNVVAGGNAYGEYETTVGQDELYVVGDNTVPGASYDSDEWGLLPKSDVTGVVTKRLEPNPRTF